MWTSVVIFSRWGFNVLEMIVKLVDEVVLQEKYPMEVKRKGSDYQTRDIDVNQDNSDLVRKDVNLCSEEIDCNDVYQDAIKK